MFKPAITTITAITISASSMASEYCAGLRGNGELAPAHWASMARIIEHKGMPKKVAGGSSAAITQFLLDAISRNDLYSSDESNKRDEQALLLKTILPHLFYLINEDANAPKVMQFVSNVMGVKDGNFIEKLKAAAKVARDLPEFLSILGEYGPLLNPELAKGLRENFSFYKDQLIEGITLFGAFDPVTDKNLFYRHGLVDFKFIALLIGRVGDFYAGYGKDSTNQKLATFLRSCASDSRGKTWAKLVHQSPKCNALLKEALDDYYRPPMIEAMTGPKLMNERLIEGKRRFPNKMIFEKVGSGLNTLPTTTVLQGDAPERYKRLLEDYNKNEAKNPGEFTLDFENEMKYGYWGVTKELEGIQKTLPELFPSDLKSSKFMALKGGTWFEVLATSPAEPGLANLQKIPFGPALDAATILGKKYFKSAFFGLLPTLKAQSWFDIGPQGSYYVPYRSNMISAGGWSDLHPNLVLKASGCQDIVYVTRQGGESVFGQQVLIRLSGYADKISFWKEIKEGNRRGWTELTQEEEESPWNRLYNLANPESSYNLSVKEADAVYCTDWDKFKVLKGEVLPLLEDAYEAPLFLKNEERRKDFNFGQDFEGKSPDGFPGCILKDFD